MHVFIKNAGNAKKSKPTTQGKRKHPRMKIWKKEVTEMSNNGYAGKIKNRGAQHVKAPFGSGGAVKGNVRIQGNDLRTGTKGSKKSDK